MKNMRVDVYTDSTLTTLVNGTTFLSISAVNVSTKTLTLAGTDFASVTAGHYIVPRNSVGKDMAGIGRSPRTPARSSASTRRCTSCGRATRSTTARSPSR
jgi:hypothetical protein